MQELTPLSRIVLYVLLAWTGFVALMIWRWQIMVLRGRAMKNPDGSSDDWHEQKTHYGIALADVFLACPLSVAGIILIFAAPRWGYYLIALVSFWSVWANLMTTATSLRFHDPKINLVWIITFPLSAIVGLAYIAWTIVNFDAIYF